MDDQVVIDKNLSEVTTKSLNTLTLLIALTFKWGKKEQIEKLSLLMRELAESMSDEEKVEFTQKAKELGLIGEK